MLCTVFAQKALQATGISESCATQTTTSSKTLQT